MPAFLTHFVFDIFAGRAAIDADRQHHGFPMAVFYVPAHSVFDVFGFKMAAFIAPPPPYFPQFRFFDFAFSFHSFYSVITTVPNKSPEPMRVGAGSSASRSNVIWSRMAQLRMLGIAASAVFSSCHSSMW
jgi:hypothetical protein